MGEDFKEGLNVQERLSPVTTAGGPGEAALQVFVSERESGFVSFYFSVLLFYLGANPF